MADSRGDFLWQMASGVESILINVNRGANSKSVSPDELNPYSFVHGRNESSGKITGKAAWTMLKQITESGALGRN